MVEIIIINSDSVREMTPAHRDDYRLTLSNAWVNTVIKTEETNVEMLPAGFWATLCYKNNRAVVFRHNLFKNRNFRGYGIQQGHNSKVLGDQFSSIFENIANNVITGDVILYRSSRTRWASIKYPLYSEVQNTFFIMTGRTGWVDRAYPVLGREDNRVEMPIPFIRFRANMKYSILNAQKHQSQRIQASKEFQRRTAAVFSMLNMPSETWDDEFEEHTYGEPHRTGFLMWREGKVIVWWHKALSCLSPQHLVPTTVPRVIDAEVMLPKYWEMHPAENDFDDEDFGALGNDDA